VHALTWREAYEHVFGAERLLRRTPNVELWERSIARPDVDVFVVEDDAGIVGWVSVGPARDDDAAAELYGIYVRARGWGSGLGRALMQAGLQALRARFDGDAILWVLDDNPRARAFYEREGWRLDGATKEDEFLEMQVREVRYRISLS
jgi:GNAT superfamily N-acetyltransferase